MKMDPVVTSTSKIWVGDDGVVHLLAHAGAEETLETAKAGIEVVRKLTGNVKRPLLVDIRSARSIEAHARRLWADAHTGAGLTATAILVKSGISRAIGNFMRGVLRPRYPMRLFTSEPEALAWLRTYVQSENG